jgi:O-antigen ligase
LLYAVKQFFVISDFDQAMIDSTAADIDTWKLLGKIRAFGLFSGPFHLGIFAAIIFWIAVAMRMQTRQRRYTILATIAVAACIASLTRASLVALIVSIPVVLFLIMRHERKKVLLTTAVVLAVAISGFHIAKATSSTVASVVEGYSVLESLQDDGRLQGRFDDYTHAIRMFSDNPLGAGMGSASDALGSHFTASGGEHLTSHNLLLWVGIETGIIGLLLFLGLLTTIGLAIRKLIKLDDRPMAAAACGAMVTVLITGLTGSTLSAYPVNLIFWTLSGCYIGYLRTLEPERARGKL